LSEKNSSPTDARRPRGVLAPVLTPFHSDLSPDAGRLARHCRWLLAPAQRDALLADLAVLKLAMPGLRG